jgi:small conductance mechanosensitive channel
MNFFGQFNYGAFMDPSTLPGAVAYGVFFGFAAWLTGRMVQLAVQRILAHDTRDHVDRTAVKFLAQLTRFGVYVFAFISYAHLIPALSGLGSAWLTSVSVISVIFGLAAQSTLGNLIAGISLLLYRPFKLGDRLQVMAPTGLETGVVESLTLGYTLLKTDDHRRIVLPNSVMASQTTINLTGNDPRVISSIPIGIGYDADIDAARAILLELARQHSRVQEVCGCPVTQLAASSVVLTLSFWCANAPTADAVKCDLLEQTKKRFDAAGIRIPFPHTAVVLEHEHHPKISHQTAKNP